jgi:hypothetical protein
MTQFSLKTVGLCKYPINYVRNCIIESTPVRLVARLRRPRLCPLHAALPAARPGEAVGDARRPPDRRGAGMDFIKKRYYKLFIIYVILNFIFLTIVEIL